MTIIRTRKAPNNYTLINNTILNDDRLSWQAKGLAAYLLSKPDDWNIQSEALWRAASNGLSANKRILRELETYGYLTRRRTRTEQGTFVWERILHDVPQFLEEETIVKNPSNGHHRIETIHWKPRAGNHALETSGWFPSDIVSTDTQILKLSTERDNSPSPSIPNLNGQSNTEGEDGGSFQSESEFERRYRKLLAGMDEDQKRAFEMLFSLEIQPSKAAALAKSHEFQFLLDHVAAFADDLDSGAKLQPGALVARIQRNEEPRALRAGGSHNPQWLLWAREQDRRDAEARYGAANNGDNGENDYVDIVIG